jgi:hypothetical protein
VEAAGRAERAAAAEEGSRVEAALDAADVNIRLRARVSLLLHHMAPMVPSPAKVP